MNVLYTKDDSFELRPWGGRMCFLGTEDSVKSKLFGVTAVLRMGQKLTHSIHTHDDCDEVIFVLGGEGRQLFQENGEEIVYDLRPGDLLYIAKNRVHRTDNVSLTDDLELFIVNYFCEGQSDAGVKGYIAAGESPARETAFGKSSAIVTEETCGNKTCTIELITLEPGKKIENSVACSEEFIFCLAGEAVISDGHEVVSLSKHAQAFFFKGETYSINNTTNEPVQLLCACAL